MYLAKEAGATRSFKEFSQRKTKAIYKTAGSDLQIHFRPIDALQIDLRPQGAEQKSKSC